MVTMLYLHNGRIFDGETFLPPGEALLIQKNNIFRRGKEEELRTLPEFAAATPLDARGGSILPAFTDSHVHLASTARHRLGMDCSRAASREGRTKRAISGQVTGRTWWCWIRISPP